MSTCKSCWPWCETESLFVLASLLDHYLLVNKQAISISHFWSSNSHCRALKSIKPALQKVCRKIPFTLGRIRILRVLGHTLYPTFSCSVLHRFKVCRKWTKIVEPPAFMGSSCKEKSLCSGVCQMKASCLKFIHSSTAVSHSMFHLFCLVRSKSLQIITCWNN